MKTFASLSLLLASASAFAPNAANPRSSSTAVNALIDEAFGIGIETGNKCTPLGRKLLEDASPDGIKWFQNAELKHGRIAMVATIGFWVQKLGIHFPLYLGPSGSNGFNPASSASNWLISTTTGVSFP